MTTVTTDNYQAEIQNFAGVAIIVFTASWDTIGTKTLDFLGSQPDLKVCTIDFDDQRELAQKYSVRRLPVVFAVKGGKTIGSVNVCEDATSLQNLLKGA